MVPDVEGLLLGCSPKAGFSQLIVALDESTGDEVLSQQCP